MTILNNVSGRYVTITRLSNLIAVNVAVLNMCLYVIILKYQPKNMHTIINVPSLLVSQFLPASHHSTVTPYR